MSIVYCVTFDPYVEIELLDRAFFAQLGLRPDCRTMKLSVAVQSYKQTTIFPFWQLFELAGLTFVLFFVFQFNGFVDESLQQTTQTQVQTLFNAHYRDGAQRMWWSDQGVLMERIAAQYDTNCDKWRGDDCVAATPMAICARVMALNSSSVVNGVAPASFVDRLRRLCAHLKEPFVVAESSRGHESVCGAVLEPDDGRDNTCTAANDTLLVLLFCNTTTGGEVVAGCRFLRQFKGCREQRLWINFVEGAFVVATMVFYAFLTFRFSRLDGENGDGVVRQRLFRNCLKERAVWLKAWREAYLRANASSAVPTDAAVMRAGFKEYNALCRAHESGNKIVDLKPQYPWQPVLHTGPIRHDIPKLVLGFVCVLLVNLSVLLISAAKASDCVETDDFVWSLGLYLLFFVSHALAVVFFTVRLAGIGFRGNAAFEQQQLVAVAFLGDKLVQQALLDNVPLREVTDVEADSDDNATTSCTGDSS